MAEPGEAQVVVEKPKKTGWIKKGGKWVWNKGLKLVGPPQQFIAAGMTHSTPEVAALCKKLKEGADKLSPAKAIHLMKMVYIHLKTGTVDKKTAEVLGEILEKFYLRQGVRDNFSKSTDQIISQGFKAGRFGKHPPLRDFIDGLVSISANKEGLTLEQYATRMRNKGLLSLTEDQVIAVARITVHLRGGEFPDIAYRLTGSRTALTVTDEAALLLELHSANLATRNAIVQTSNSLFDSVNRNLSTMRRNPVATQIVDRITKVISEGTYESAQHAVGQAISDNEVNKTLTSLLEREINLTEAHDIAQARSQTGVTYRDINREVTKIQKTAQETRAKVADFLKAVSEAKTAESMGEALSKSPKFARRLVPFLRLITGNETLMQEIDALRVLEKASGETGEAVRTGVKGRARFARSLISGAKTRLRGAASRLSPIWSAIKFFPSKTYIEIAEMRVKGVRPRRLGRAFGYAAATVAAGYGIYKIGGYIKKRIWGTQQEQEEARKILEAQWGIKLSDETFKLLTSPGLAKDFFDTQLDIFKPPEFKEPIDETELAKRLAETKLFINPFWLNELAKEVEKIVKKKGAKIADIKNKLNEMKGSAWWRKGYFSTFGGIYIEHFSRQLKIERTAINQLKKNHDLFILIWEAVNDGSLPRSSAQHFVRHAAAVAPMYGDIIRKRAGLKPSERPTVRQSLDDVEWRLQLYLRSVLLENAIPQGSLMDVYDQYAMAKPKKSPEESSKDFKKRLGKYQKFVKGFKIILDKYRKDEKVRQRLNAFRLKDNEAVYVEKKGKRIIWNIEILAKKVAEGKIDYAKAKEKHIIADNIFQKLRVYDRKLVEFVYKYSYVTDKTQNGLLKWLKDKANAEPKSIVNAEEIIKHFQGQTANMRGMTPGDIYKFAEKQRERGQFPKGSFVVGYGVTGPAFRDKLKRPRSVKVVPTPKPAPPKLFNEEKFKDAIHEALNTKPRIRGRLRKALIEEYRVRRVIKKRFENKPENLEKYVAERLVGLLWSNEKADSALLEGAGITVKKDEKGNITAAFPDAKSEKYNDFKKLVAAACNTKKGARITIERARRPRRRRKPKIPF